MRTSIDFRFTGLSEFPSPINIDNLYNYQVRTTPSQTNFFARGEMENKTTATDPCSRERLA